MLGTVAPFGPAKAGRYLLIVLLLAAFAVPSAQESAPVPRQSALDQLLDLYVRDGFVYYRALKADRAKLDGYVSQMAGENIARFSRDEQVAFWLNAYNALVLRTVIDRYPIQGHAQAYPSKSIRQIPGAFESVQHRVAGRTLTLDEIEKKVLPEIQRSARVSRPRPRRGGKRAAAQRGVLPARLDTQLSEMAAECTTPAGVRADGSQRQQGAVSAIFSWREKEFSAAYGDGAARRLPAAARSSAPCCRSSSPSSWPRSASSWPRTRSRSSSSPSTGR